MKRRVSTNDFTPHTEDRIGVESLAELNSRFALTSRGRVWSVSVTHRFNDADTKCLSSLPRLAEFNIFHFTNVDSQFTHSGVASVLALPRVIGIADCNNSLLGDKAARHISTSSSLRWVKLPNCGISDQGVSMIARATQLIGLSLSSNYISDRSVPSLCRLVNLRYLWINDTEVTHEGVQEISATLDKCKVHKS